MINFDELSGGELVTNQYAEATFSSNVDIDVMITAQDLGSSNPNFICTGAGSIDRGHDVFVDFTNPVNGLHVVATGADDSGVIGQVRVLIGGVYSATVDIIGFSTPFSPVRVGLSGFANVTGIEIVGVTNQAGLGYDDFAFDVAGIPEPVTWAVMLLGFGAISVVARRRARPA